MHEPLNIAVAAWYQVAYQVASGLLSASIKGAQAGLLIAELVWRPVVNGLCEI